MSNVEDLRVKFPSAADKVRIWGFIFLLIVLSVLASATIIMM